MSEKLCLKWNDFQNNTNAAFGSLRNNNNFTDVTLACEDGQQLEAHKVILAASSPFFQNLLERNKHPHPLVYMRGVKSQDLNSIVDFLYFGEASVHQENIDAFLALAEELSLKGLAGNQGFENMENVLQRDNSHGGIRDCTLPTPSARKKKYISNKAETKEDIDDKNYKEEVHEVEEMLNTYPFTAPNHEVFNGNNIQELDERVKSLMTTGENYIHGCKAKICTICGKEGTATNIMDHIEGHHLEGVSILCTYCEKTFRSRKTLRQHKRNTHV